jgi:hypothetical protein
MGRSKRARLEAGGWRLGSAEEFLAVQELPKEDLASRLPSPPRPTKAARHAAKAARKRAP